MTKIQKKLTDLINHVASEEDLSMRTAFRDLLTDMRHVADYLKVDFIIAADGSYEVYCMEKLDDKDD